MYKDWLYCMHTCMHTCRHTFSYLYVQISISNAYVICTGAYMSLRLVPTTIRPNVPPAVFHLIYTIRVCFAKHLGHIGTVRQIYTLIASKPLCCDPLAVVVKYLSIKARNNYRPQLLHGPRFQQNLYMKTDMKYMTQ